MDREHIMELGYPDVLAALPDRDPNAHKGCFGKILLLCGSRAEEDHPGQLPLHVLLSRADP